MNKYIFLTILLVLIVDNVVSKRFYPDEDEDFETREFKLFMRRRFTAAELLDALAAKYVQERSDSYESGSSSGGYSSSEESHSSYYPSGEESHSSYYPSSEESHNSYWPSSSSPSKRKYHDFFNSHYFSTSTLNL